MDPVFVGEILVHENAAIALKFIESMGFGKPSDEDRTVDKLKADSTLRIRTLSGMDYEISVRAQLGEWQLSQTDLDLDKWRQAIFNKWKHHLTGKS